MRKAFAEYLASWSSTRQNHRYFAAYLTRLSSQTIQNCTCSDCGNSLCTRWVLHSQECFRLQFCPYIMRVVETQVELSQPRASPLSSIRVSSATATRTNTFVGCWRNV